MKCLILAADPAKKIEVDPDLKIDVFDVYKQDPAYLKLVHQVADNLRRYSVKFNLKEDEILKMFLKDLKETF